MGRGSPNPGVQGHGSFGVQPVILQIDVEEPGLEPLDRFRPVVLAAQVEIGRFIDNAEVLAPHLLQHGDGLLHGFEQAAGVGLVGQPDVPFFRLVRGPPRPGDVFLRLHADPDQVGVQQFGQVQVGRDVPQGVRGVFVVRGDGDVSRDHGNGQTPVVEYLPYRGDLFQRRLYARLGRPHAHGGITDLPGQVGQVFHGSVGFFLVQNGLGDPYGQREFHSREPLHVEG